MGAEIGLVPMNQISQSSQSQHRHKNQLPQQPNPNPINTAASSSSLTSWMMWNPTEEEEEEESWEVRAFAEDTRNIMGTTWPPRSYTCTFCRREFRSAQALGGHMNVHRRDRARLHQAHHHQPGSVKPTSSPALVANAGLCLLYHLPSPNTTTVAAFTAPTNNINGEEYSTSTLLPISSSSSTSYPVPNNNLNMMMQTCSSPFQAMPHPIHHSSSSYCRNNNYSSRVEQQQPATSTSIDNGHLEELDLELRLGHKPPPT